MALYTNIKGPINYTAIGIPTIEDGIVSGFTESNYLTIPYLPSNVNTLDFCIKFKGFSYTSWSDTIFINRANFSIEITNNKYVSIFTWTDNTAHQLFIPSINTDYWVKVNYIKNTGIWSACYSTDGITWTQPVTWNTSFGEQTHIGMIGKHPATGGRAFDGSIDLNETYININGNAWFGTSFSKVKLHSQSAITYAKVGNVSITDNGVASGFTNKNDYLTLGAFNPGTSKWKFTTKVKIDSFSSQASLIDRNSSTRCFQIAVRTSKKFRVNISTDGSTKANEIDGTNVLSLDTIYYVSFEYDGSKYYLKYSTDNINWTTDITINNSNAVYPVSSMCMGHSWYNSGTEKWNGEIYLRDTHLVVESSSVDTWKLHALEGDYVIVDDKLVWANPNIYLQNNSTNYINVNYVPKNNTAVIIDFKVDDVRAISSNTRNWICGGEALYNKPGNFYGGFWFQGTTASGSRFWFNTTSLGSGTTGSVSSEEFILHKYKLILASPYNINYRNSNNNGSASYLIQINENRTIKTTNNLESNWGELSQSIVLFNRTATLNSSTAFLLGKIYKAEIWEDNNLIKKLVPVPKGLLIGNFIVPSNGMFDIIEQKFYGNSGTGDFTIGGISGDYINVGDNIVWTDNNVYLKCNGAQYFDSNFKANQDTKVDIDYTPYDSGVMTLYSCRDGAKLNTFTCFSPVSGTSSTRYDYNTTQNTISSNPIAGTRRHILADKNKFYIDDVLKYTATYVNFQCTNNMIFGCSYAPELGYANYSKFKYHKIQLYDNGTLIRYFLPVNTGTRIGSFTVPAPGMWDAITKTFYPNQGTGTFTYGKDE